MPAARFVLGTLGLALALALLGPSQAAFAATPNTSTVLTVSPSLVAVGNPVTMTAAVTGTSNPPGSVVFASGGTTIATVPLTPVAGSSTTSQAVLVTSSLPAGTYAITATYNSSDLFNFDNSTSAPASVTVSGATIFNTTTTLSTSPPSVVTGQPETLTAHVLQVGGTAVPTGIVTFSDNGVLLGQATLDATGTATLTRSDFIGGSHTITADYAGDSIDRASSSSATLQVTAPSHAVQTTTTVTATPNPIVAGRAMTITAHVVQTGAQTPPPGGAIVTFRTAGVGGAFLAQAPLDANGNATVTVAGWIPGHYVIEADYVGDINDLSSSGTVPVVVAPPGADLSVSANAAPASAHSGDQIAYSFVVANAGLDPAQNVRLTDQLPAGTTFVSSTPACKVTAGVATCALGTMASGAQQTVTIVVAVGPGLVGTSFADTAQVTSDTVDPNPANNATTTATTQIRAAADLRLAQTGTVSLLAGGPLGYTLTVTNAGPDAATNVVLSDLLPAGLTAPLVTTTAGTCTIASGALSCQLGTLAAGAVVTVTVNGTLSSTTAVTSISNTASVSSSTDDLNTANNSATVVTAVTPASSGCEEGDGAHGTGQVGGDDECEHDMRTGFHEGDGRSKNDGPRTTKHRNGRVEGD